jgi:hypothetical protein
MCCIRLYHLDESLQKKMENDNSGKNVIPLAEWDLYFHFSSSF